VSEFPSASGPRIAALVGALLLAAAGGWLAWTWWSTEQALDRQDLRALSDRGEAGEAAFDDVLDVLVVGNDDRSDLTEAERRRLHTGSFDGARTDTILWVQLRPDGVSLVSFPRDLLVDTPRGGSMRINQVLEEGGREALVGTVEELVGAQLEHYVEVSIASFLDIVDAAGGVEICLDEPLRDDKSGADFAAGCHTMDGVEALAYVRSREGERGDFARVERQQAFLAALADRATSLPVLANPVRLRRVATSVASGLTVDDGLTVSRMLDLGRALQDAVGEGLDTFTVPAHPDDDGGPAYVLAYEPALAAIGQRLRTGEPFPHRPDGGSRGGVEVDVRPADSSTEATRVESVLFFAGFDPDVRGPAPAELMPLRTTVYTTLARRQEAEVVAAVLGAPVRLVGPGQAELEEAGITVVTTEPPESRA
jgi:LCP family protein required for cell wall assembly